MKKFVSSLILTVAAVSVASAQVSFDSPENKPYFGVRASLDITCPGNLKSGNVSIDVLNPGAGFSLGAIYNIPVKANFYFEPGLGIFYNTSGEDIDGILGDGGNTGEFSGSIREFGFRAPLQLGYHFDFPAFKLHVFTGPELNLGIIGREHNSVKYNGVKQSDSYNIYGSDGMFKRFDIAWRIGAGISVDNYYLSLSGSIGMLDRYKDDPKLHQNVIAVTLGYNF